MTGLAKLQSKLQADIRNRTRSSLEDIRVPAGKKRETRLGVYQDAYRLRLVSILEEEYPVLRQTMGEKPFWRIAARYIAAHPSDNPNARMFPVRVPSFLSTYERYANTPYIAEIAALENAFSRAFDAPDSEQATMETLASLPPEKIADMTIDLANGVQLVNLTTNAADIWQAVSNGDMPPEPEDVAEPVTMLVWRQERGTKYRPVCAEEAMLLNEAPKGKTFAHLSEMAAMMEDPDAAANRLAGYLTTWIIAGMVAALTIEQDLK